MPLLPNNDLVAVAWIGGIPGLSASMVSTNLPQDVTTWQTNGFITTSVIGGSPDLYLPIRKPVVQIDCWAVNPNSGKPPWGKANQLAELVRDHVQTMNRMTANFHRLLSFPQGNYSGAVVMDAMLRTEPRRAIAQGMMPVGDEASYARYLFDVEMHWRVAT